MSNEAQITTDDEQSADLAASVAESRELAILRAAFAIVRDEAVAAMSDAFKTTSKKKQSSKMHWSYTLQEAAGSIDRLVRIKEQAVVSRDGHG